MMRFRLRTLLIVLAIVPMVWGGIVRRQQRRRQDVVRTQLSRLHDSVECYLLDTGALPTSLDDLMLLPRHLANPRLWDGPYFAEGVPLFDLWGEPYGYKVLEPAGAKYRIWSNGPDRRSLTADDICTR